MLYLVSVNGQEEFIEGDIIVLAGDDTSDVSSKDRNWINNTIPYEFKYLKWAILKKILCKTAIELAQAFRTFKFAQPWDQLPKT